MGQDIQSMRDALLKQALGDLDTVLGRAESILSIVDGSEKRLQATAAALDKAGEGYRLAVTTFTESAKVEISEFTLRESKRIAAETLEDARASMHAAASAAFRLQTSDKAAQLAVLLNRAVKDVRQARLGRILEHLVTASATSALTAALLLFFARVPPL